MIKIKGLNFSYTSGDEHDRVFNSLNLKIETGQCIALIGPSGCGKTTLLDIIAGFRTPDTGHIQRKSDGMLDHVGYLFQEYPFLPRKTAAEHIAFPLLMEDGITEADRSTRISKWLDRIGLSDSANKYIDELSTGMKARVALATVLIDEPSLLLLDEPFRALDIETRVRMWEHLKNANNSEKVTTFLVTHDLKEAIVLSDEIIVLTSPPSSISSRHTIPDSIISDKHKIFESREFSHLYEKLWIDIRESINIDE